MKKVLSMALTLVLSLSMMTQMAIANDVRNDIESAPQAVQSEVKDNDVTNVGNITKEDTISPDAVVSASGNITVKSQTIRQEQVNTFYGTVTYRNPAIIPWTANFVKYIPRFEFNYYDPISGNVPLTRENWKY